MASVAAFIDGLNLYHGMEDAGLLRYRWMDVHSLAQHMANDAFGRNPELFDGPLQVTAVTYCTSYVSAEQSRRRQDVYLQALAAHKPNMSILLGRYEAKARECKCECGCHNMVEFQKEKRTDVNLAVEMLKAVGTNPAADVFLLITGDTDLVPAVQAVQDTGRPVIVVAPPARHQEHLNQVADVYLRIGKRQLKYSPLPELVMGGPTGEYPLSTPDGWLNPSSW